MSNKMNLILCALLVAGCMLCETNEMLSLAFIGIAGGVVAVKDYRRIKAYERAKANCENIDYLTDLVMFGEWEMN